MEESVQPSKKTNISLLEVSIRFSNISNVFFSESALFLETIKTEACKINYRIMLLIKLILVLNLTSFSIKNHTIGFNLLIPERFQ